MTTSWERKKEKKTRVFGILFISHFSIFIRTRRTQFNGISILYIDRNWYQSSGPCIYFTDIRFPATASVVVIIIRMQTHRRYTRMNNTQRKDYLRMRLYVLVRHVSPFQNRLLSLSVDENTVYKYISYHRHIMYVCKSVAHPRRVYTLKPPPSPKIFIRYYLTDWYKIVNDIYIRVINFCAYKLWK